MKSDNYYGIGSNEYGLYKTVDNGRTWSILNGSSASSMTEAYNRIIFGSTEDKGLTYSDDGGVTIVNSDTTTGNWDGIAYENSVVYAHSMDGAGIAYSKDNGETWKILCGASADAVLAESDGYIYYQSDLITVPINTDTVTAEPAVANASVVNGEYIANPITSSDNSVQGVLLVVLNDLLMPKLVNQLTGYTSQDLLNFTDGMTLGNMSYKSFFSGKDVYAKDVNSTTIDWEDDIGMMPFSYDVSDVVGAEVDETTPISEGSSIDMNDTLKNTLDIIQGILDTKLEYAKTSMANSITSVDTSAENLMDLDLSSEEYANALKVQNMFYNVLKGSTISIMGTLLNYIYTFDTNKKISLLKAAIYETLLAVAPSINYQLKAISKKIQNSCFTVTDKDLNLSYDFASGLETAIQKYLNSVFKNVRTMTSSEDKDLIGIAADKYKSGRSDWINSLSKWIIGSYSTDIDIDDTSTDVKSYCDNTVSYVNTRLALKKSFNDSVSSYVDSLSDDTVVNAAFKTMFETYVSSTYDYDYGENLLNAYVESFSSSLMSEFKTGVKKELSTIEDDTADIKAIIDNYYSSYTFKYSDIDSDRIKLLIAGCYNTLNNNFKTQVENISIDDNWFDDDDYDGSLDDLSASDIKMVYDYYKQIFAKFKSRCLELLDIVYDSYYNNLDAEYYVDYIADGMKIKIESFNDGIIKNIDNLSNWSSYHNVSLKDSLNFICSNGMSSVAKGWSGTKEMI